jgi:hypothetical protein
MKNIMKLTIELITRRIRRYVLGIALQRKSGKLFCLLLFAPVLLCLTNRKKSILYIHSTVSNYEIKGLSRFCDYNFIPISPRDCKTIYSSYIVEDASVGERITDGNYHRVIQKYEDQRRELYCFWLEVFQLAGKLQTLDGILSPNFNYLSQQEMCRAATEVGIPYIVLVKEGVGPRKVVDRIVSLNEENIFLGTRILFYNEYLSKKFLTISGINEANSCSVGFPRIQSYPPANKTAKSVHTLFVTPLHTEDNNGLPEYLFEKHLVLEKVRKFYCDFTRFATANPQKKFIVKFKELNHTSHFVSALDGQGISVPNNCEIVGSGDPVAVLCETIVAFGYASTVLLESLYWGAMVIEPKIIGLEKDWSWFGRHPDVSTQVGCLSEIEAAIKGPLAIPSNEAVRAVLEFYFGQLDGLGYKRIATEISRLVD